MGNFLKGFSAIFLITFFILGASGCSEESSVEPDDSILEFSEEGFDRGSENIPFGTEGMPEGYLQVSFEDMMGFDAFMDMEKFRPGQPSGFSAYELTDGDLNRLATWRSPKGVPWTVWAFENELTQKTHERYGIRGTVAGFVIPDQTYQAFGDFLLRQEGIELSPEALDFFSGGGAFPEELEALDDLDPFYVLTGWFRENVSAMTREPFTAIAESYAWYTSPNYEKGTLPGELEAALDLVGKGVVSENYKGFGVAEDWANEAAEIIRGGQIDTPEGPFYASVSDRVFLQMEENLSALGFYRDLQSVVSSLEENPQRYSEVQSEFKQLLENFPMSGGRHILVAGKTVLADFEFLEEFSGQPDETLVFKEPQGEMELGLYRDLLKIHTENFNWELLSFIRQWSELQSSGD